MCCWCAEQLLNQLDGAGPPPASKDQIDALPLVTIVQEQVGELLFLLAASFNEWVFLHITQAEHRSAGQGDYLLAVS